MHIINYVEDYQNFKYFKYEKFTNADIDTYGIYNPADDCFITITTSIQTAFILKSILSSRYFNLHICRINSAKNFSSTEIDTLSSQSLSLSNRNTLDLVYALTNPIITVVDELCITSRDRSVSHVLEHQWVIFCTHWIDFIQNSSIYYQIDMILNSFLQLDLGIASDVTPLMQQQIFKLLYFGMDILETEQSIKEILGTK
jgi:hypothetical protein